MRDCNARHVLKMFVGELVDWRREGGGESIVFVV